MRVVCASKIDLKELVERNLFAQIYIIALMLLPMIPFSLQNRYGRIFHILVNHFLQRYVPIIEAISITDETMQLLTSPYDWPGKYS